MAEEATIHQALSESCGGLHLKKVGWKLTKTATHSWTNLVPYEIVCWTISGEK